MGKVGYRFRPTEQELVDYFLYDKITENPILDGDEDDDPVKMCDLYGDQEPWDLWNFYGGKDLLKDESLYFFTRLKKLSPNGSRFNRKIGSGAWQGEEGAKAVMAGGGSDRILGFKKRFRYENSNNSEQNGGWIMNEYTIHPSLLGGECSQKAMDYVLCCMKKNKSRQQKEKSDLDKKPTKSKQMGENNGLEQRSLGRKWKLKEATKPNNRDDDDECVQNKRLKAEQEAFFIQPTALPCINNVLEVVESEAETERYSDLLNFETLFSDINPSVEAESTSLTFDIAEWLSPLDQREEIYCIECPVNVNECIRSNKLRSEEEEEELIQVIECGVKKNPLLEYEGFYSNKLDEILERVLTNVDMETLEQWAF